MGATRPKEPVDKNDLADLVDAAELERMELDNNSIPAVALTCSRRAPTWKVAIN